MGFKKIDFGSFEKKPPEEKTEKAKEKEESEEIKQANISHEYLREYKHYQNLNESYQNTLRVLDKLREEGLLGKNDQIIKKLESELKSISALMDGSQRYMERLFSQLSDEAKEKYLKPERTESSMNFKKINSYSRQEEEAKKLKTAKELAMEGKIAWEEKGKEERKDDERPKIEETKKEEELKKEKEILAPFTEGRIVKVRRSSGVVESDWVVFRYNKETDGVIVQKEEKTSGDILQKEIPLKDLKDLNPDNQKPVFSEEYLENRLGEEEQALEIIKTKIDELAKSREILGKQFDELVKQEASGREKDKTMEMMKGIIEKMGLYVQE